MQQLEEFQLVGVDGLMKFLNEKAFGGDVFTIEESQKKLPERNPFLHRFKGIEVVKQRTLLISRPAPGGLFAEILGCGDDIDKVIARVFAEGGDFTDESGYCEFIKVRFLYPIQLKSGLVIPKSTIKVYIERNEWGTYFPIRKDHIRKLGAYWRSNLRRILPDRLFLASQEISYR